VREGIPPFLNLHNIGPSSFDENFPAWGVREGGGGGSWLDFQAYARYVSYLCDGDDGIKSAGVGVV
jgi:hypothetical protein